MSRATSCMARWSPFACAIGELLGRRLELGHRRLRPFSFTSTFSSSAAAAPSVRARFSEPRRIADRPGRKRVASGGPSRPFEGRIGALAPEQGENVRGMRTPSRSRRVRREISLFSAEQGTLIPCLGGKFNPRSAAQGILMETPGNHWAFWCGFAENWLKCGKFPEFFPVGGELAATETPLIGSAASALSPRGAVGDAPYSPYPASDIRSASASSTETIWLTPRSAIVTPNSRSMRAMVIGLWVMVTKRVSERLRISSRRSQKRSTL